MLQSFFEYPMTYLGIFKSIFKYPWLIFLLCSRTITVMFGSRCYTINSVIFITVFETLGCVSWERTTPCLMFFWDRYLPHYQYWLSSSSFFIFVFIFPKKKSSSLYIICPYQNETALYHSIVLGGCGNVYIESWIYWGIRKKKVPSSLSQTSLSAHTCDPRVGFVLCFRVLSRCR